MRAAPTLRIAGLAGLIFVVSAARLPGTFLFPAFWAEDGTSFFRDSIEIGVSTLWTPIVGMYMSLQRIAALLALLFPVQWAPMVYALSAGAVSSLSLTVFSRRGLRWLVPQDWLRVVMCLLFSLVPGTNECLFALCTQTYILFVGVLLLLMERNGTGGWLMGWRRTLLLSFLWFSVGQSVVLAPLLVYLLWRTRNRNYLVCLLTLGLSVALNILAANPQGPRRMPSAEVLAQVFADNTFVRLVYVPTLGIRRLAPVLQLSTSSFLLLSTLALVLLIYAYGRVARIDSESAYVLAFATLAAISPLVMAAAVRYYALDVLMRPNIILGTRYSLLPSILALILGYMLLTRPLARRSWQLVASLALVGMTVNILAEPLYYPPHPFRPFVWEWPRQAEKIQRTLDRRRAGTLRRTVIIGDIPCRPGPPYFGSIVALRISP